VYDTGSSPGDDPDGDGPDEDAPTTPCEHEPAVAYAVGFAVRETSTASTRHAR